MIPEPITATISKPVPSASATRRRVEVEPQRRRCRSRRDVESSRRSRRPADQASMRWRSSRTVASNAAGVPTATGIGDRPVQPGVGRVEFLVRLVADRDHERRHVDRRRRSIVARSAASRELGAPSGGDRARVHPVGGVGAGRLGRQVVTERHSAAASWLRAELRVHTNNAGSGGGADRAACLRAPRVRGARSGGDRPRSIGSG